MGFIQQASAAIRRQPAVPAAILFILGISAYPVLPQAPAVWLVLIAVLVAGAIATQSRATLCFILISSAIFISGVCSVELSRFRFARNHIATFAGDEPRLAWVEGRIRQPPRLIAPASEGRPLPEKQTFLLEVRAVRLWRGWAPAAGDMPVTISPPVLSLATGQSIRLLGRMERPEPAMNPGGFDSAEQYRRERVLVTLYVSRPYDAQILSPPGRFTSPLVELREACRRLLERGFGQAAADSSLLTALVFGDREPELRDTSDDFIRSGTTHILAANGTRIAMLAGIAYLLFRLLHLPPRLTLAAVTACITLFGVLTVPLAQAIRPIVVFLAVGFGLLGNRPAASIQLLALAALALLVFNPQDLYSAGFQLSFVIVLGLIVLTRPFLEFLGHLFENRDREVAESFLPQTAWRRWKNRLKRTTFVACVAGLVAWLVVIPLAAYHFEQFNPWTVPFGVLLSPIAVASLVAGFLKIVFTAICPPLAAAWASACAAPVMILRHAVHWMARVPGADLPMTRPGMGSILLYYTLLVLPLIGWPRRPVRWCARCAPVGACAMLVLPLCGGVAPHHDRSTGMHITLLSLGAGQCAVVEPADGGVILVDAGSSTLTDPCRTCMEPFLRHEQCRSIDSIWLSHGDYDHISAVRNLMPEYDVHEVVTSPSFRRHAHESKPCNALLEMLDGTQRSPHQVVAGNHTQIGNHVAIEVLWPPADCSMNSNNAGMVLRLTCAGRSILFPADIQEPAERELLKHPERLRSDVLVAPHHGSHESTTARFVAAVDPKVIAASNDERLSMKQRIFDAETSHWPLYRTSRCGAITIDVANDGTIRLTPFLTGKTVIVP